MDRRLLWAVLVLFLVGGCKEEQQNGKERQAGNEE